jgi:pimeloyl-ACP methyl ester carboxylesterase
MNLRLFGFIAAFALVLAGALVAGSSTSAPADACHGGHCYGEPTLPIVFVHGGAGSGAQYEVPAQRFASNGYPNVIRGIDRLSSLIKPINEQLDEYFDAVMAETGDDQIYVAAHSAGTSIMVGYLNSSPERSARVAKYINIDGAKGETCPGNPEPVPCLNISQSGSLGPNNVNFPQFQHTQCVTAVESFVEQYKFLTGKEPKTTLVVPEFPWFVTIAGRAIYFPANTAAEGSTLEIWEVDGDTGARKHSSPKEVIDIGADGEWGPVRVNGNKHYEFTLYRTDVDYITHYYFQPFIRDNHLIRLLVAPADSALYENTPKGPDHTFVIMLRYFDYLTGAESENDTLWVTTTSPAWDDDPVNPTPPTLNILSEPNIAPRANKLGIHAGDFGLDKVSTLLRDDWFYSQFFQTGVDIWMPATEPPDGTITFVNEPGKYPTLPQTMNIPNWSSDNHRILVMPNAYFQEVNSWCEYIWYLLRGLFGD